MTASIELISFSCFVEDSRKVDFFKYKDIVYIIKNEEGVFCFLASDKTIKLTTHLIQLSENFKQKGFVLLGETCLINLNQIRSIRINEDTCRLVLNNGKSHTINTSICNINQIFQGFL